MKITAITKFKHGNLWAAIKQLHWSQRKLGLKCGMDATTIGSIFNLRTRPSENQANAIQQVLGEQGIYLDPLTEWPETFKGFSKPIRIEQTKDISANELEIAQTFYNQLAWEDTSETVERENEALKHMRSLTDRERHILELHFGLAGEPKNYRDIGDELTITGQRVKEITDVALRKLRNTITLEEANPTKSPS